MQGVMQGSMADVVTRGVAEAGLSVCVSIRVCRSLGTDMHEHAWPEASLCSLDPLAACSGFSSTRGSRTLLVAAAPQSRWQAEQATQAPRNTKNTNSDTLHCSAGIGHVIVQPACSLDLNPLDLWPWNAVKREMFAVRGRIPLEAEASRAWAAVRSSQIPKRLLRDCENRFVSCVATNRDSCEHISTDSLES